MDTQHCFILDPCTRQWRSTLSWETPWKVHHHPYFYEEILVVDYMGLNWATPEDILEYLQQNQSARRLLRRISEDVLLTGWDTTYIVHPLLNPPLRLNTYLSDDEFIELINNRLATEQRVRAG
ncbi:hypothetical protein BJ322DRAFT_1112247 [Thelephora terrestris]|uniref:Uncharacterized protein n=1 Tax=Thelephora terrestris TaxID=56493 RepID=A0A9P6H7P8_9AGAM|nr:hypothetical protein BJ322DRAFT_1112247 [Thelephora terrestris]